MKVWAVANQKGGVGKTTTTVSLAGLLVGQGKRVLMVDMDPHGSLTAYFGENPDALQHSVFTLFQYDGDVPEYLPAQLVMPTNIANLSFLPSSTSLAMLERQCHGKSGMGLVLKQTLAHLKQDFDYVLIDTPPILGMLMVNAMAACERVLMPVQTEHLAIKGLERMMRTLTMVVKSQHKDLPFIVVPTMFDRRTQASLDSLRILRHTYQEDLAPMPIPIDTRFRNASKAGLPPNYYDRNSRGVKAYTALLNHLFAADAVTEDVLST